MEQASRPGGRMAERGLVAQDHDRPAGAPEGDGVAACGEHLQGRERRRVHGETPSARHPRV
ncbi:hypothetical protein ABIC53_002329 [Microbacterium sp. 1262]